MGAILQVLYICAAKDPSWLARLRQPLSSWAHEGISAAHLYSTSSLDAPYIAQSVTCRIMVGTGGYSIRAGRPPHCFMWHGRDPALLIIITTCPSLMDVRSL